MAQNAIIQFIHTEVEHSLYTFRRIKEVYRKQYLERYTIFCWYQHYNAGHERSKAMPIQAGHIVTYAVMIATLDALLRENCQIPTRDFGSKVVFLNVDYIFPV